MATVLDVVRIIFVDDHTLLRDGLRRVIADVHGLTLVGDGSDSAAAVTLAREHQPDVIVLDTDLPGDPVAELVPVLGQVCPAGRIILLTGEPDPVRALSMLSIGDQVYGYLVKDIGMEQLVASIRTVARGQTTVASSKGSLVGVLDRLSGESTTLTDRERQVLRRVAAGMTSSQIAAELFVSEGTVRRHLTRAYGKLGASNRVDAVRRATAEGLIGETNGMPLLAMADDSDTASRRD